MTPRSGLFEKCFENTEATPMESKILSRINPHNSKKKGNVNLEEIENENVFREKIKIFPHV